MRRSGLDRLPPRASLVLLAIAAAAVAAIVLLSGHSGATARTAALRPVGIVNAFGPEQAAILDEMRVTG